MANPKRIKTSKRLKLTRRTLDMAYAMNKTYDLKMQKYCNRAIAELIQRSPSAVTRYLDDLKKSVGKEKRELLSVKGRPVLTEKQMEMAYKLNQVYDLKMAGRTNEEIAGIVGLGETYVSEYLNILRESVSEEKAKKLSKIVRERKLKLTEGELEFAYRLNRIYDMKMAGLSQSLAADRVFRERIERYVAILKASVGPEKAKKLGSWKRRRLSAVDIRKAYRMNIVYDLRVKRRLSYKQILAILRQRGLAKSVGTVWDDVHDLADAVGPKKRKLLLTEVSGAKARRERKRAGLKAWLEEHPFRPPPNNAQKGKIKPVSKRERDRIASAKWDIWAVKPTGQIQREILRLDRQIATAANPNRTNKLAIQRGVLTRILENY